MPTPLLEDEENGSARALLEHAERMRRERRYCKDLENLLRGRAKQSQLRASNSVDRHEESEAWSVAGGEDNPYLQMMRG